MFFNIDSVRCVHICNHDFTHFGQKMAFFSLTIPSSVDQKLLSLINSSIHTLFGVQVNHSTISSAVPVCNNLRDLSSCTKHNLENPRYETKSEDDSRESGNVVTTLSFQTIGPQKSKEKEIEMALVGPS